MTKEKTSSQTQYLDFDGKAYWCKVYTPDEFRGNTRWMLDLYMDDPAMLEKYKKAGIQKKLKENENGKGFSATRPVTKLIKGTLVHFTPPIIYDKDGTELVKYVDAEGKTIRQYSTGEEYTRVGEPVMIGNGSTVRCRISVYPTSMGPGNRLESIKILDLITYERPENPEDSKEEKGEEVEAVDDGKDNPLW